ncbi:hypothetical protein ENBRE01_1499 [Enteropsectra breve]|nr:hypothetical protein ENBRE01_1499 [Enteropsectra breve]
MATAQQNPIPLFSGNPGEDLHQWLRNATLITRISGYDETTAIRTLIFALRGEALSWAALAMEHTIPTEMEQFVREIKTRFSTRNQTDLVLENFLNTHTVNSSEEYNKLLKEATQIFEKGLINKQALIKMVIAKSPSELKSYLFQTACSAPDWITFVKNAEDSAWIAFSEKSIN